MNELAPSPLKQRHLELHERCRHPSGKCWPLDWQSPEATIPARFAEMARAMPQKLAVYDHTTTLTYAALDQAVNRVAHAILAERGPGTEAITLLVGVDVPSVIAALGVLKAGKVYTVLEPSFPGKRSSQILADAETALILADEPHFALARELAGSQCQVLQLERLTEGGALPAPDLEIASDAPAILNYTSGSTGLPKGVLLSHASALAHTLRWTSYNGVSHADRIASFGSLAWAGPFRTTFGPLCLGASAGRFDLRQQGVPRLVQWLQDTAPTVVGGLTAVRQIAYANPEERFPSVRVVNMGGDTVYRRDVEACLPVFPNATVGAGFGTTEAGSLARLLLDSTENLDQEAVPMGFPMPGLILKLVSEDGKEVSRGEVGEVAVLSHHLAMGYWRRPDLTAEKFLPAGRLGEEPAYLTGDLACQMPDGMLRYMGRKDHVVKIRGLQVYTNEIDALLRDVKGVGEACVIAHSLHDGTQRLVAYLVVDRQAFPGVGALHAQFADAPRHMVPQSYVFLDTLPRTPNGKPDRQRLVLPARSRANVTAGYAAPRCTTETMLAALWEKVLGIEGIGVHDSFLELGGDSLESTRIINRVVAGFGVDISLQEFFEAQTIAQMASIIQAHQAESGS